MAVTSFSPVALCDRIHGRQRALEHVVLERHVAQLLVRIDPGQDEGGEALVDAELDEAVLGLQVEDVELVDPGRHDHQRPTVRLRGRGRVLDQLHELGLEHDLARAGRDIAADLERIQVGHPDRQLAFAAVEVLQHVLQAAQQVLAAGLQRQAQHLGIGGDEVGGRHHLDELARVELELLLGLVVQTVLLLGSLQEVSGGQQIGLLDEVEQRVVVPGRVLEPPVAAVGHDHRVHVDPEHALGGAVPEPDMVLPQAELRLSQLLWLAHHPAEHLEEGAAQGRMAVHLVADAIEVALPGDEILDQLAAALGDLAQDRHDLVGLVGLGRHLLLLGHLDSLSSPSAGPGPCVGAPPVHAGRDDGAI